MKINIGTKIDLVNLIATRMLIQANSGGGKSWAVRKLIEEAYGNVIVIVLDAEGEFFTLREKFDFLLIGKEGDVELNVKAAKLLPKSILENNVSSIIDISELQRSQRVEYMKNFLEALMELPRNLWKPCIVVIDEAHSFCGQQEKQDSFSAVIDLMTRGRKRGFCGILCTQRISKLHKDAAAEANNKMIGRTGLDIDMKRASEELGFTSKDDMRSLRDLDPGEFYVFGPSISREVKKIKVGKVQTTHPHVGMNKIEKITPPTDKIKKILAKLSDLPKEQEKKLKTEEELRTEIRNLKSQIAGKPILRNDDELNKRAMGNVNLMVSKAVKETTGNYEKVLRQFQELKINLEKIISQQEAKLNKVREAVGANPEKYLKDLSKRFNLEVPIQKPISTTNKLKTFIQNSYTSKEVREIRDTGNPLGICAKKIYSFLFYNQGRSFTKSQIGVATGYASTSGGFNNSLSQLSQMNLINKNGNVIEIANVDESLAGKYDFSKEAIIKTLGKCEREIYEVLLANPYEEMSREQIAEQTPTNYAPTSGGYNNALSRLATLGILIKNRSHIKLNPEILEI